MTFYDANGYAQGEDGYDETTVTQWNNALSGSGKLRNAGKVNADGTLKNPPATPGPNPNDTGPSPNDDGRTIHPPVASMSSTATLGLTRPAALDINASNVTNPKLPEGGTVVPALQQVDPNLMTDPNKFNIAGAAPVQAAQANFSNAQAPTETAAAQTTAATIGPNAPQSTAQQGTVQTQDQVEAQQQQGLSPELKQELDQFNAELDAIGVDPTMTVQGQYAQLMTGFDNGGVPAWAQGAYKAATQRLAARGLSGSTMAGEAISTAIMQAALPIAVQDAQVFKDMKLAVLDKKAQGVFLRAGFIANLDMKNLDNRQQAAVVNAQTFLAMDMKNLDNSQQTDIINTQARLQGMLSDQSAINAANQFNAASVNQTNQYYAGLKADISKFNAAQYTATSQFNAGQANSIAQFNAAQDEARQEFNAKNSILIDQSNAAYLRNINTQNTATINQANIVNSQNLVNISNTAMANEIQMWRDQSNFLFQHTENALDRANNIAITQMQNEEWFKRYNQQQEDSFFAGVGNFLFKTVGTLITNGLSGGGSSGGTTAQGPG